MNIAWNTGYTRGTGFGIRQQATGNRKKYVLWGLEKLWNTDCHCNTSNRLFIMCVTSPVYNSPIFILVFFLFLSFILPFFPFCDGTLITAFYSHIFHFISVERDCLCCTNQPFHLATKNITHMNTFSIHFANCLSSSHTQKLKLWMKLRCDNEQRIQCQSTSEKRTYNFFPSSSSFRFLFCFCFSVINSVSRSVSLVSLSLNVVETTNHAKQ